MTLQQPAGAHPRLSSSRARWAVPAVTVVAVAGAFAAPPLLASADADLPDVSAAELVARVAAAEPLALQGTVVHTARLGLPDVSFSQLGGADPVNLLSGSSTLRVWTDGESRSRVALLGSTSEYSVVTDGAQAWTYSSSDDEVVHYTVPDEDAARLQEAAEAAPEVAADLPTPEELGEQVLARAEEDATVGVDAPTTVAGRDAYQVVVTPTSTTTLVGRIVVAVDAETSTPLRVQVWSSDDTQTPALELGFTDVSFSTPADSVLTFSPPPGAQVREVEVPLPETTHAAQPPTGDAVDEELPEGVTVHGTGWDTVVEVADVDVASLLAGDPAAVADAALPHKEFGSEAAQGLVEEFMATDGADPVPELDGTALYDQLTTPVDGGRLLSSSLMTVLVTDDGRVLVGAVPAAALQDLAG